MKAINLQTTANLPLIGALLLIGIAWGLTVPLSKVAVSGGCTPLGIMFWEQLIVALIMGLILVARAAIAHQKISLPLDRGTLLFYLMVALLGTVFPNFFSYWAVGELPAAIIAIIIASVPMFALTIAVGAGIEPFMVQRWLGVCLGGAAVVLLVAPEASLPNPEKSIFVLVALAAAFCYGLEGNYIARCKPLTVDPIETLFGASIVSVLIIAPLSISSGAWINLPGHFTVPEQAILGIALFHAMAYSGYVWLVGRAGPVFSSQVAYVITLSALILSMIFLQEALSAYALFSLVLMLVGLAMVQPRRAGVKA
ncbi:MAG: DMT family transporter [Desulfohalobiaceae bacterium]|nr:DMT family transporter [Desulfohalobiaceae bacterium]